MGPAGRFCAFLASLRTRCKLTQSEVAKQLYVNQSTVAKWESGKLLPDAGMLKGMIEEAFPLLCGSVEINPIGTVIGTHTGPGTVALFYFSRDKRAL